MREHGIKDVSFSFRVVAQPQSAAMKSVVQTMHLCQKRLGFDVRHKGNLDARNAARFGDCLRRHGYSNASVSAGFPSQKSPLYTVAP